MPQRRVSCSCGQLSLTATGEPVRISVCYCRACQRRTGSAFGAQARFPRTNVSALQGRATSFTRTADSGNTVTFHFCPDCGATVMWEPSGFPDVVAVALGAFEEETGLAPRIAVYEACRWPWVPPLAGPGIEHND